MKIALKIILGLLLFCSYSHAELAPSTVYLTWQNSPDSTMTIQWLTEGDESLDNRIIYRKKDDLKESQFEGSHIKFPGSDRYWIHSAELTGLSSDTDYVFKLALVNKEYLFHTLPSTLQSDVRFVVGGDMYHDDIEFMEKISKQAAKTAPHFALLGGDIAYTVSRGREKKERWIEWISSWNRTMITPQGRTIPVMAALGNHDIPGEFDQTPEKASIFRALFPQAKNQTYNVRDFGSYLSIYFLDSGHANPIGGKQSEWLKTVLQERKNIDYQIALYHVPAYPCVRSYRNKYSAQIRSNWIPLFEQGRIGVVFEHHDHAYKRTRALLKNRQNSEGIVYMGDGAWGVEKPRRPTKNIYTMRYLTKSVAIRHFILGTVNSSQAKYQAIDEAGNIFDEYSRPRDVVGP